MSITVYSSPNCHWSRRAIEHLRNCGADFIEKDVTADAAAGAEMVRISGQRGVPVIVTDDETIVGYDEKRLDRLCSDPGPSVRARTSLSSRVGCSLGCLPRAGAVLSTVLGTAVGARQAAATPPILPRDPPAVVIPVARSAPSSVASGAPSSVAPGAPSSVAPGAPSSIQAAATAVEPPFVPFWARNHRVTEMWSGPASSGGAILFGQTSEQFCIFYVVNRSEDTRRFVFNPYSQNYFWIDSRAIGPVGTPDVQPGAKPPGQNCATEVYAS